MSDPGAVHPVVLNVGGMTFSSSVATLTRYPDSLLARLVHRGTHGQASGGHQQQQPLFVDRDGTLFRHILGFLRDGILSPGLQGPELRSLAREAAFFELHVLLRAIQQAEVSSRAELLELRFSLQEGGAAFFRVFGSRADSVLALGERVRVSSEHELEHHQLHMQQQQQQHHPSWAGWPLQAAPVWSSSGPAASLERVSLQRPSHHDFVFQCGPGPSSTGASFVRYVSIDPDQRRLTNGVNVLGLLIDTILREGFRLVAARTTSPDDRVECYTFVRGHPMAGQEHAAKSTHAAGEQPIGAQGKAAIGKPAKK